ncbi:MAG: DUF3068 domain-containing protein [Dehalococcoidia bacterium]|nr:DUF3068 domain-containing protein [Dehalococcoidia bacterium]
MVPKGNKGKGFIVSVFGLLLAVLGVIWIVVIFPSLDKMPGDYARTFHFVGEFSAMNQQTQQLDTFPVEQKLTQEAVETLNGAIRIHEVRTISHAQSGDVLPQYGDETIHTIDRRTLEYMANLDERGRTGNFGPVRPCTEDATFDLWNAGANEPLTASFSHAEEFRGLKVNVFEIEAAEIPRGKHPQTGADLFFAINLKLWIEPSTGAVVNQMSTSTTSMDMMENSVPVQISKIQYADTTVETMVDFAGTSRNQLMWFRDILPWVLIGVGGVLVLLDVLVIGRRKASA